MTNQENQVSRNKKGWHITDKRSDQTTPLNQLLNQFGVFLDPDWDDFMELDKLECVQFLEREGIARHPMGDVCWAYIYSEDTKYLTLRDKCYSLEEWLVADWDTDAWGSVPELLAAWRFDAEPYLDLADEDYEGTCKIWIARNYHVRNIGTPVDGYMIDDELSSQMWFYSFQEAQEWVDKEKRKPYRLGWGEYSSPEYIICKA